MSDFVCDYKRQGCGSGCFFGSGSGFGNKVSSGYGFRNMVGLEIRDGPDSRIWNEPDIQLI